jgi:hypothetical protein
MHVCDFAVKAAAVLVSFSIVSAGPLLYPWESAGGSSPDAVPGKDCTQTLLILVFSFPQLLCSLVILLSNYLLKKACTTCPEPELYTLNQYCYDATRQNKIENDVPFFLISPFCTTFFRLEQSLLIIEFIRLQIVSGGYLESLWKSNISC